MVYLGETGGKMPIYDEKSYKENAEKYKEGYECYRLLSAHKR